MLINISTLQLEYKERYINNITYAYACIADAAIPTGEQRKETGITKYSAGPFLAVEQSSDCESNNVEN